MKIGFAVLAVAFASGCGAPTADEHLADVNAINSDANAQRDDAAHDARTGRMKPVCRSGKPIGAHCGLIMKRAAMDDFRASFHDKKCASITEDACQDLFESSIDGWLQERYKFANFDQVDKICVSAKNHCVDPNDRELLLQQSYNDAIQQVETATEHKIEDQREAQLEQQELSALDDAAGASVAVRVVHSFAYPGIKGGVHQRAAK